MKLAALFSVYFVIMLPESADGQFHLLMEDGRASLVDFAGEKEQFDRWSSSKEGLESRKSVSTFYSRSSCSVNLAAYLRQCSRIEVIWLGISPDSAVFEEGAIRELSGLSYLRELRLCSSKKLSGEFSLVRGLDSLAILDLEGEIDLNQADLEAVGNFKNLTCLNLNCGAINDCAWLKQLAKIEDLCIVAPKISNDLFYVLSELPRLKKLQVYGIEFDEAELIKLSRNHRESLNSIGLELKHSTDIDFLSAFPKLQVVNVRTKDSGVSDFEFLSKMEDVCILYTNGWKISGSRFSNLEEFGSLEQVRIEMGNKVLKNWHRSQNR